jgi:hypothetical protein
MHFGGFFRDLGKDSDCANHEILLTKLHFYGVQGVAAKWFRFSVTGRKQKVKVKPPNNTQTFFSNWGAIKHGVLQGSVLWF